MNDAAAQPPQPSNQPRFRIYLRTILLVLAVLASSMATFGTGGIVVFVLVGGLAYCARYLVLRNAFEASASSVLLFLMLLPVVRIPPSVMFTARESDRRLTCQENLKQIIVALNVYDHLHGSYPPAFVADKSGKPMYSWRVLILPQLDLKELYNKFNLNEPWDGPNNKKLIKACPRVFICPSNPPATRDEGHTNYVAVVGPNAAWTGAKPRTLGAPDSPDEPAKTVMLVESADSNIAWSEPGDLSVESMNGLTVSSNHGLEDNFFYTRTGNIGAEVAFADSHVSWLPNQPPQALRKLLSVGGLNEEKEILTIHQETGEIRLYWSNIATFVVWLGSVIALLISAVRNRLRRRVTV